MQMKLNLIFNSYPILQRCSYVIYKIIIPASFVFISFQVYVMNFSLIPLKIIYSANLYMSLNSCVNFRDLSCQHMCIDNRLLQTMKLNSIKLFNNIIHFGFYGLSLH